MRTAKEAGAYLEGLIDLERMPDPERKRARFSLDAIRALLRRLDDPHRGGRFLHLTGSKGKGSTALLAEALLLALGRRVGTFTSPHLERWSERFRIDGCEVDDASLARAVTLLRPHVDAMREEGSLHPTFFDATTAAALLVFAEAEVDEVVLEVGLGGRLDSTNVVLPQVTAITSIELEHTAVLGDSLAAIAGEKAGILKPRVPVVLGALASEAREVVLARAREIEAPVLEAGFAFEASRADAFAPLVLRVEDESFELPLAPLGAHQAQNAAIAFVCVQHALGLPATTVAEAAARAFAAVELPGRAECVCEDPLILIDSAHTAASAEALAGVLDAHPAPRTHLVISVSTGKALGDFLAPLLPRATRVTLTRADPKKSLDPADVARVLGSLAPGLDASVVPNPHLALRAAREDLAPDERLCVAGSVYLAGIARAVLRGADAPALVEPGR